MRSESTCPECGGTGKKIKKVCPECSGVGRTRKSKTLNVKIPAGINDDQTIRLAGEGNAGVKGGANGDLLIHVSVKKHEVFERDGNNIHIELPITFSQAALGANIEIKTLHGNVSLKSYLYHMLGAKIHKYYKDIYAQFGYDNPEDRDEDLNKINHAVLERR